jgi:hypothetical protein
MHLTGFGQHGFRRMDAVGIGLCVLMSLASYLTTVRPFVRQRSATAALRQEMRAQQEKAAQLETAIGTVKEQLRAVRQDLAAAAIQLDSAAHINRRVAALTEFFAGCEIQVDDVQTGRTCAGPRYDLVPITIVGSGAYRQCVKLLHGLCGAFPDMSVMRIELAGNPAQALEPEKFQLVLFWYAAPGNSTQDAARERSLSENVPSS